MKAAIAIVLLAAAVAVSAGPLGTCRTTTYRCQTTTGSCNPVVTDTAVTNYYCSTGYAEDRAFNTSGSFCTCAPDVAVPAPSPLPVLGAACTYAPVKYGMYECKSGWSPDSSVVSESQWWGLKTVGDLCSSNYECSPDSKSHCAGGKCVPYLTAGAVCYNATASMTTWTEYCPVKYFCNATAGGPVRWCEPRLAEGAVCDANTAACPQYTTCRAATGSVQKTCIPKTASKYWIPTGQMANTTSTECWSGIWNATTKMCLDEDIEKARFAPLSGIACTDDSQGQCGAGTCECNGATGTGRCVWNWKVGATVRSDNTVKGTQARNLYNNDCDGEPWDGLELSSADSALCTVRYMNWISGRTYACNLYTAMLGTASYLDCGQYAVYKAACGALHNAAVSFASIIALTILSYLAPKLGF